MSDAAATPQKFRAINLFGTLLSTTRENWLSMLVGGLVVLLLGLLSLFAFVGLSSLRGLIAFGPHYFDVLLLLLPLEAGLLLWPRIALWFALMFITALLLAIPAQAGLNLVRTGSVSIGQAIGKSFGRWFALGLAFLLMQLGIAVLEIILVWVPTELNVMLGVIGNIVNTIVVIAMSLVLAPLLLVILDGSGVIDAFGRVLRLTRGHRLSILLFVFLAALPLLVVMLIVWMIVGVGNLLLYLLLPQYFDARAFFEMFWALFFYSLLSIHFWLGASLAYTRLLAPEASRDGEQQAVY